MIEFIKFVALINLTLLRPNLLFSQYRKGDINIKLFPEELVSVLKYVSRDDDGYCCVMEVHESGNVLTDTQKNMVRYKIQLL